MQYARCDTILIESYTENVVLDNVEDLPGYCCPLALLGKVHLYPIHFQARVSLPSDFVQEDLDNRGWDDFFITLGLFR